MLDMHTHILPGVDDGPSTLDESIRMLQIAEEEGIERIISTSHFQSPQYSVSHEQVAKGIELLKQELIKQKINVALYTGHEIRLYPEIVEDLKKGVALSLAKSNYVLVEFPSGEIPEYTEEVFREMLSNNYVPVIAHPERNKIIAENPNRLYHLVKHGALAQITASSLHGHFGSKVKQLAIQLIEANCIHFIGSDVHNLTTRPFYFNEGLDALEAKGLHESLNILLENNERIINNEAMVYCQPMRLEKKKWWKLF